MKSLMQELLGDDWARLPHALQQHYQPGITVDIGRLDIEYPLFMQPILLMASALGALVRRRGQRVPIRVQKADLGTRQYWRRTLHFADGTVMRFDSLWKLSPQGQLIEFVNPWLGLQMQPVVVGSRLHYRGVRLVIRWNRWTLPVPEWLVLGHTTIVEEAVDDGHFTMDFRLRHPLFGQVFRYSGLFKVNVGPADDDPSPSDCQPA